MGTLLQSTGKAEYFNEQGGIFGSVDGNSIDSNSIDGSIGVRFLCAGRGKFMEGLISTLSEKLPAGFLDPADHGGFLTDVVVAWVVVLAVLFALNLVFGLVRRQIVGDVDGSGSGSIGVPGGPAVSSAYRSSDSPGFEPSPLDGLEPVMRRDRRAYDTGAKTLAGPVRPRGVEPMLRHQQAYQSQGLKSKASVALQDSRKKRKKAK